jgi:hypothetical protein
VIRGAGLALGCSESVFQEVEEYDELDDTEEEGEPMELDQIPPPSRVVLGWYEEATPLMDQLQQYPKSFSVKKKLNAINLKIERKNEEEEQEDKKVWSIDYDAIAKYYEDVRPFIERLKKNGNDEEATNDAKALEQKLAGYLEKNNYPRTWGFKNDILLREPTSNDPDEEVPNNSTEQVPSASAEWRPGLTVKGEEIYAMQPFERTSRVSGEKYMERCYFLVAKKGAKKGQKSLVFEDSEEIGQQAATAYLKELSEEDRVDVRTEEYKRSSADKSGFVEIDDIAVKEGYSSRVYPGICIRTRHTDGKYRYPNRTVFRKIWGAGRADQMIENFYLNKSLAIPWVKRAKHSGVGNQPETRSEQLIQSSTATREERGRRRSFTERSTGPDRSRFSSRSSSHDSIHEQVDEKLRRLEQKLEQKFDRKLDEKFQGFESIMAKMLAKLEGMGSSRPTV